MRALVLVTLVALLSAGCLSSTIKPASIPQVGPAPSPFAFTSPQAMESGSYGSEPSIGIDPAGRIWVSAPTGVSGISKLWMSADNGTTWKRVDYNPFGANGRGLGGGDTSIAIGKDGSVWVTDLWVGSSTVAVSKDAGKSWTASPIASEMPYYDREWNTVDAKGHGYYLGRTFSPGVAAWVSRSDDGGKTWMLTGNPWINGPNSDDANRGRQDGAFITNPKTDAIGVVYSCSVGVCVSTSSDLGMTWKPVVAAKDEKNVGNLFPALAADADGNWYVAWSESQGDGKGHQIKMAWSPDAKAWTTPVNVTTAAASRLMPWMVAGAGGRVAIAWYETPTLGDTNDQTAMKDALWNVALAQSLDATSTSPTFTLVNATSEPIHKKTVSTRGFNPQDPNPPDRGLGDFFTLALDARGMVHVAFVTGSHGEAFHTVHVAETAGPSLYVGGHAPVAATRSDASGGLLDVARLVRTG